MAKFKWRWPWQRKVRVYAVHAEDMVLTDPDTDWSRVCSRCQKPVGLYPSGQKLLAVRGEANVEIICTRCEMPAILFPPAADVAAEIESVENPHRKAD